MKLFEESNDYTVSRVLRNFFLAAIVLWLLTGVIYPVLALLRLTSEPMGGELILSSVASIGLPVLLSAAVYYLTPKRGSSIVNRLFEACLFLYVGLLLLSLLSAPPLVILSFTYFGESPVAYNVIMAAVLAVYCGLLWYARSKKWWA